MTHIPPGLAAPLTVTDNPFIAGALISIVGIGQLCKVVKFIASEISAPLTTAVPDVLVVLYPTGGDKCHWYVPFEIPGNTIVFVFDDSVVPFKVADHVVPAPSPDSVNETEYLGCAYVIATA